MNTNLTELILNQAPEVCEQMVSWGIRSSYISAAAFSIGILISLTVAVIFHIKYRDDRDYPSGLVWALFGLLMSTLAIVVVANVVEVAKIKTAPKAWLVDRIISKTK